MTLLIPTYALMIVWVIAILLVPHAALIALLIFFAPVALGVIGVGHLLVLVGKSARK